METMHAKNMRHAMLGSHHEQISSCGGKVTKSKRQTLFKLKKAVVENAGFKKSESIPAVKPYIYIFGLVLKLMV